MNEKQKVLIVGGVAGGATAAARLRRLNQEIEIILFERGEYISYANCGLPYYIGGIIEGRENLFVTTKEDFANRYNVDIRALNEVTAIDREQKQIEVKRLDTNEVYQESYDKLIIATGSSPIVPKLPGIDNANVFSLWTVKDTDAIYDFIQTHKPQHAVVVGGGFIGVEMAENLVHRNIKVTMLERLPQLMAVYDPDMAKVLENKLIDHGVTLQLGKTLSAIEDEGKTLVLESGERIPTDMVILSLGTRPNCQLAQAAGLDVNTRGGIMVDASLQTSDPDIYAVGDVIEVEDFGTGLKTMIPLAGPANKQGRIVADSIMGRKSTYHGSQGTSIIKLFDLTAAVTGLSETALGRLGKKYREDYLVAIAHPNDHAGYYPGASAINIKLIFDLAGKVLGAQALGYAGVDKRIDVIATAIRMGANIYDLQNLDLAYAPPYSSAKDPVNVVGYMAANQLEGLSDAVLVREIEHLPESTVLLDVRENEEIAIGTIPGAITIPLSKLRERLSELNPAKEYVLYCMSGLRSYLGERILKEAGFKAKNLQGAYRSYCDALPRGNVGDQCDLPLSGEDSAPTQSSESNPALKNTETELRLVDACGQACPGPIMTVSKTLKECADGDKIKVLASDPGFVRDIASWCENTGNLLLEQGKEGDKHSAIIQKGQLNCEVGVSHDSLCVKEKTMIIFSGDLDKAIASFIIANGAAAMGNKVNMFFTFWGLNILRKPKKQRVQKNFIGKMFSAMLPRGSQKLGLSRMNFAGAGAKMIRGVMKQNNVASLEEMIQDALQAGIKITACQMSMDLMGIKYEELIEGVEIAGVAAMLNDNDHSNMNLFI